MKFHVMLSPGETDPPPPPPRPNRIGNTTYLKRSWGDVKIDVLAQYHILRNMKYIGEGLGLPSILKIFMDVVNTGLKKTLYGGRLESKALIFFILPVSALPSVHSLKILCDHYMLMLGSTISHTSSATLQYNPRYPPFAAHCAVYMSCRWRVLRQSWQAF